MDAGRIYKDYQWYGESLFDKIDGRDLKLKAIKEGG